MAKILGEMIETLTQAEGAASQLIHMHGGDPRWIMMRQAIELTKMGVLENAKFAARKFRVKTA